MGDDRYRRSGEACPAVLSIGARESEAMTDTLTTGALSDHDSIGVTFDPFHGDQLLNPYPVYERARAEEPVFYSEKLKMWYVTRYDDIVAITKDPVRFSSSGAIDVPVDHTKRTQ